jgi:hypothetical protein
MVINDLAQPIGNAEGLALQQQAVSDKPERQSRDNLGSAHEKKDQGNDENRSKQAAADIHVCSPMLIEPPDRALIEAACRCGETRTASVSEEPYAQRIGSESISRQTLIAALRR